MMTKSLFRRRLFSLALTMFLLLPVLTALPVSAARTQLGEGVGVPEFSADSLIDEEPEEMPGPEVERLQGAYLYNFENDQVVFEYDQKNASIPHRRSRS